VTLASGQTVQGDFLVLAAGSQPNFFHTPGAEHSYPLYSLEDAQRLRSRILALFEAADRDPSLLDRGALNFLIVGAGPTGVETAGALADLISKVMPYEYRDLAVQQARVILVELTGTVLPPYTEKSRTYAAEVLQRRGVELASTPRSRRSTPTGCCRTAPPSRRSVIWSGGLKAAPLAASTGLTQGRGGRIDVQPDLRVPGHPGVYALGDFANLPAGDGTSSLPQLASVAQQAGRWAARNIRRELLGKRPRRFIYFDKGILAMIGRSAAIAELGPSRVVVRDPLAYGMWLGVHAWLLGDNRARLEAAVDWSWDFVGNSRGVQVLDRSDLGLPKASRPDW
jgi:NADH dehydrogenase